MRIAWLFALLFIVACDRADSIDKGLVNLYVDLRVATLEYSNPTEVRIARQNVMREAGYTPEKFSFAINNIRANPELWVHFQQAVADRLDTLRSHLDNANHPVMDPPKPPVVSAPITPNHTVSTPPAPPPKVSK